MTVSFVFRTTTEPLLFHAATVIHVHDAPKANEKTTTQQLCRMFSYTSNISPYDTITILYYIFFFFFKYPSFKLLCLFFFKLPMVWLSNL